MTLALEAVQVTKEYPSPSGDGIITAVDRMEMALERGEFVALVGPSGSGKTTMLAMLAGLLAPNSGAIRIAGQDLTQMRERERTAFRRREIGFTFQDNNLVPYLTALENVEYMLRLNGEYDRPGRERARELLVRLGLEERLKSLPRQLSGGQQQRVAIARSLINQPTLVLADEPTASLDTERAFQVVETMAQLVHAENRAAIMVTHDLRMVEYCDRVIQMVDGRLERVLSTREDITCLVNPALCERIPLAVLGYEEDEALQVQYVEL
ncbi:MAG: ABC transporter ATP-binding protein [Chloroflexi bacterium]|jgi:putative ABC transport system ATP-binding protein|nr:ABC transporter ATP-binding protein [Chloroflexota bacterium]